MEKAFCDEISRRIVPDPRIFEWRGRCLATKCAGGTLIGPKFIDRLSHSERERIMRRSFGEIESVMPLVAEIVASVKKRGDAALIEYTSRFDRVKLKPNQLSVTRREVEEAYRMIPKKVREALELAIENIQAFHEAQLRPPFWMTEVREGIMLGQIRRPIDSVGLYVPGGGRPYPSTVLMLAVPSRVAGVKKAVMCTPPRGDTRVDPVVLVAADLGGVDVIHRIGGAQAIAALTYGTESVERVDKIVGPGNVYVTAAKMLVYGHIDVDFPAGPSEILVLADETADPEIVALELMSQAEHDPEASSVLVTTSPELAKKVAEVMDASLRGKRFEVICESLNRNGAILVARKIDEAIAFLNEYCPEHLEVITADPFSILRMVEHAGSIFLGPWSSVSAGDYATGANHVLPTCGAAKTRAGLSVDDFVKYSTVQMVDEKGLKGIMATISSLARVEELPLHKKAVERRLKP